MLSQIQRVNLPLTHATRSSTQLCADHLENHKRASLTRRSLPSPHGAVATRRAGGDWQSLRTRKDTAPPADDGADGRTGHVTPNRYARRQMP